MKDFLKENIVYILLLILFSLLLILGGQIVMHKFYKTAAYENLETVKDRIRCTKALGWEVDKGSETVKAVYIPNENSVEFSEYNKMQQMCGFDLSPYMGKGAIVYTYRILNFESDSPVNAFLNIIVYNGKMIGGDCEVAEYHDLYLPVISGKANANIP